MSTKTSKTYNAEALSTLQESVPTVESLTNDQTNVQAFVDDFQSDLLDVTRTVDEASTPLTSAL